MALVLAAAAVQAVVTPRSAVAADGPSVPLTDIASVGVAGEARTSRPRDEVGEFAKRGDQPEGGASVKPGAGTYGATSLTPSASWDVSPQTGDFSWSYPLRVPPVPGGLQPGLALSYSSSAVDGLTSSTNSQASWIGDGWSMWPGYIERTYVACAESLPGNEWEKPGDLCWKNDNATITFNGSGSALIKDDSTQSWRPKNDDGSRVERLVHPDGVDNGDRERQYWVVTRPDGTRYYFGSKPAAKSTWTVPVFSLKDGELCKGSTYDTSWCNRAYRWNLDKVVDRFGNMLTYQYETETNSYGRNKSKDAAAYTRAGWLTGADYGLRADQDVPAAGRVVFETTDRCVPGSECKLDKPQNLPDVPLGLKCDDAKCKDKWSPTFWTTKRLDKVITKVRRGAELADVDSWTLKHEMPDPGDGERAALWLRSITHTGHAGTTPVTLPEVTFEGVRKPNRASTDSGNAALIRFRMNAIVSESGGVTSIKYRDPDCVGTNLPTKPENNTQLCYPARWAAIGGTERTDYFHKYVVESVSSHDQIASSVPDVVSYEYHDGAAWHGDESDLMTDAKRSWTDFRGFGKVTIRKGSGHDGPKTKTQQVFYRGMHEDRQPGGGKREAWVTDSEGGKEHDWAWLRGTTRESLVFDGDSDRVLSKSITEPTWQGPTATRGELKAYIVRPGVVREYTELEAGPRRETKTQNEYDDRGLPTKVDDLGDLSTPADDTCTRTTYARNTEAWLISLPSRVQSVSVHCGVTPKVPEHVLSDVRNSYDGRTPGEPPLRGTVTTTEQLTDKPGGPDYAVVATGTYDTYGRPLESTDALKRTVKTGYTPATGGPVTQTTLTNPLGHTSTTTLDPAWGLPVKVVDQNQQVTEVAYDALGRTTEVWSPMRKRGKGRGVAYYSYEVRRDGPNVVTTSALGPNGNFTTGKVLYDGLLRQRQTQAPAVGGGRLLTDTRYDSQGRAYRTTQPYFNNAPIDNALWRAADGEVPGATVTEFDGLGRPKTQSFVGGGVRKWTTTTRYGGDRVHVTPPQGGTPSTSIFDAKGQLIELRQYRGEQPAGGFDKTTYTYTPAGKPSTVTDAAGNTWRYHYDLRGRQTKVEDPDKGTTTMVYDEASQLTSTTDARDKTVVNVYDDAGRRRELREGTKTGPKLSEWTYDTAIGGKGLLATATRFSGGNAYTKRVEAYDGLGNAVSWDTIIPAAEKGIAGTYTTSASYNQDGSLRAEVFAKAGSLDAETYNHGYDDAGRPLTAYGNRTEYVTDTQFTRYGELQRLQLGSGGKRTWLSGYLNSDTRRLERMIVDAEVPRPMQADINYTYDDAGNITSIADTPQGQAVDVQCFQHDYLRRLTEAWSQKTTGQCAATPAQDLVGGVAPYWQSFTYDAVGNRLTDTAHTTEGDTTRTYAYPAAGQQQPHTLRSVTTTGPAGQRLDEFGYDKAGNTTDRKLALGGTHRLEWDTQGRMVRNTETQSNLTTDVVYDAAGERLVRRDPTGVTLYLDGQEVRYTNSTALTSVTRYYHHGGQPVAVRVDQALNWLAADHQGTSQFSVNADTMEVNRRRQTPFGAERGPKANFPGEKGFVGGTNDATTGLTHVGVREYDSGTGRFISVDPIINPGDPQQLHGYSYANGSPVTKSDPTGLEPMMEYCKNWPTPDCRNHYYGGKVNDPTLNTAGLEGCKWERTCAAQMGSRMNKNHSPNFKPATGSLTPGIRPVLVFAAVAVTDVVVFAGCTALTAPWTAGASTIACAGIAGAAGGAVSGALSEERNVAQETATGAALGLLTGGAGTLIRSLISKSDSVLTPAVRGCLNSFAGETEVLMADGTSKPISEIQVGDRIANNEPGEDRTRANTVTVVHVTDQDKEFVDLTVSTSAGERTIRSTANHPFYSVTVDDWVHADKLQVGDELTTPGDGRAKVAATRSYTARIQTFNLTVDTVHTYYVLAGSTPVLVHNSNCPVYRTQTSHPDSLRLAIDSNGNVSLSGEGRLYLNMSGDVSHSLQFRGTDGQVLGFDVDSSFVNKVRELALPQRKPRGFTGSAREWNQLRRERPEISDPSVSPGLYGIPTNMLGELMGAIVPGSGRVVR